MSEQTKLYSITSANFLLGCLMKEPALLLGGKYKLTGEDFAPNLFNRVLFWCTRMLVDKGCTEIDGNTADVLLQSYPDRYEVACDNNFMEVIPRLKEISNVNNIDFHYNIVKKFSLLRYYQEQGFNITSFFDIGKDYNEQMEHLNKYTLHNIVEHFDGIMADARKNFLQSSNIKEYKAGENFLGTIEKIKGGDLIGDSFQSGYINRIFNGMYGFILRSGGSGDGKTVASVGDLMRVSATHYYDSNIGKFIENPSFAGAGLMINTELDLELELEPMLIAWISDIDRGKLRKWDLTPPEEQRVLKAQDILVNSPIYLVDDPAFTIKSLTNTISSYVYKKGVKNVFFDYLNTNGYLDAELAQEAKIPQRQDTVLQTATDRLKFLQRSLNIGLLSGTQLNSKVQDITSPHPNETWLAGGVSQVRKVDGSMIMALPTKKEIEAYDEYKMAHKGFYSSLEPNRVTHIIKGRNSEFEKYIKIFHHLDTGTCRNIDLLVLDKNNMPVNIDELIINS